MKKILATILVASMLLSCFAFVGYAAGTLDATAPEFKDDSAKVGKYYVLTDPLSAGYYDGVFAIEESNYDAMLETSPLFKALDSQDLTGITQPYTYDVGEYIGFPFVAAEDGVFALDATFTYPTDKLAFAGAIGCNDATAEAKVAENRMIAYSNVNVTGAFAIALFKVIATTGGSATIKANVSEATYNNAGTPANCTVGETELTFALNGTAAELPEATTDKLAAAVEFTGEVSADSFAQIPAAQIVSGDNVVYDYNTHGDYRIFFGKFVDATYKQPTAQGFVIEGGKETVKAAAKTTFKAGEPFGILVFGMGAQTKLTATPFIEY